LLPFFLRPDHHKIHDDENENQWHKKRADASAGHCLRGRGLSLRKNRLEHGKKIEERTLNAKAAAAIVLSHRSYYDTVDWR